MLVRVAILVIVVFFMLPLPPLAQTSGEVLQLFLIRMSSYLVLTLELFLPSPPSAAHHPGACLVPGLPGRVRDPRQLLQGPAG